MNINKITEMKLEQLLHVAMAMFPEYICRMMQHREEYILNGERAKGF